MALVRLHNDDWGYESNCFVCEQRNELGLRLPFFHDTDAGLVRARLELGDAHSGAPTLVHGGVVLAVLDEAMAWSCIAIARSWAVTTEMSTSFERPVRVGVPYDVVAEIVTVDDTRIHAAAKVVDAHERVRAVATATFTILGEAQAARLAGLDDVPLAATVRLT